MNYGEDRMIQYVHQIISLQLSMNLSQKGYKGIELTSEIARVWFFLNLVSCCVLSFGNFIAGSY